MTDEAPPFRNLIRFLDENLEEHYGDLHPESLHEAKNIVGTAVEVLDGSDIFSLKRTKKNATVKQLLSPLASTPLFVCGGLNYADHAKEAALSIPPNPVTFTKPPDALAGPHDHITIPKEAKMLDYEGELCIIISHTGKDIPAAHAHDYILGYTAGNDLSSRYWQRPPRSGGQFSYAKSFDGFAPIGPSIAHPSVVGNPSVRGLSLVTRVNGEVRQNSSTANMIFGVEEIVEHVSRGTTLRRGTVIMTGTPAGIAGKMPGEPWLADGDVVEVGITGIGMLRNKIVFGK